MKVLNQKGSLHLGLIVALVVVAGVAFAGYRVWSAKQPVADTTAAAVSAQATVPTAIHTKADLAQTGRALDQESSQLDSSLDSSALSTDINALL